MKKIFNKSCSVVFLFCIILSIILPRPLSVHADGDTELMEELSTIMKSASWSEDRKRAALNCFSAIVELLRAEGWSETAISGAVANLHEESGFDPYRTEGDGDTAFKIYLGDPSLKEGDKWRGSKATGITGGVGLLQWSAGRHVEFNKKMMEYLDSSGTKTIIHNWYGDSNKTASSLETESVVGDIGTQIDFMLNEAGVWGRNYNTFRMYLFDTYVKSSLPKDIQVVAGSKSSSSNTASKYPEQKVFFTSGTSRTGTDAAGEATGTNSPVYTSASLTGSITNIGSYQEYSKLQPNSTFAYTFYVDYWYSKKIVTNCSIDHDLTDEIEGVPHTHTDYVWEKRSNTVKTIEYSGSEAASILWTLCNERPGNQGDNVIKRANLTKQYDAFLAKGSFSEFVDLDTSTSIATALSNSGYWTDEQLSSYAKLMEVDLTALLTDATREDLSSEHLSGLVGWEQNVRQQQEENGWIALLRKAVMIVGILFTVWVMFIYIAYWFDRLNNFFYIDLLGILTLGHLHISDDERECTFGQAVSKAGKKTVNHRAILTICLIGLLFGVLVVSGVFYTLLAKFVRTILNFLS